MIDDFSQSHPDLATQIDNKLAQKVDDIWEQLTEEQQLSIVEVLAHMICDYVMTDPEAPATPSCPKDLSLYPTPTEIQ